MFLKRKILDGMIISLYGQVCHEEYQKIAVAILILAIVSFRVLSCRVLSCFRVLIAKTEPDSKSFRVLISKTEPETFRFVSCQHESTRKAFRVLFVYTKRSEITRNDYI